ncbi:MAG: hypothetical protein Q8O59_01915 [bacterium]|nr:hypothetical protein [bacterium]
MIFTGEEIKKCVSKGKIIINPFFKEDLNPNSYNYHLGHEILELNDNLIDTKKPTNYKKIILKNSGYILKPGKTYLGHTNEEIGSEDYLTILIGRSSVGRLGLFLQITADLGHVGLAHSWTLELHVVQPLKVYPLMKIGQVSFWEVIGKNKLEYEGKYHKYSLPHISEIYNEF